MNRIWKTALAYTCFNAVALAIFAGIAWASPDRDLSDFDLAIGIFLGASIYPMGRVIDGAFGAGKPKHKPRPSTTPEVDQ